MSRADGAPPPPAAPPPGATDELPLFPLKTVLLPGGPLTLRVFEPRYVDLVARCLRGVNRFGVVAIRSGDEVGAATTYDFGTAAEIVDWQQQAGGLLGIVAIGREPFRLLGTTQQPDGLYIGRVEWLPMPKAQPLPAAYASLATLLRKLADGHPAYLGLSPAYDDAGWVAGRLIETLPLAIEEKQELLELAVPAAQLERLVAVLRSGKGGH